MRRPAKTTVPELLASSPYPALRPSGGWRWRERKSEWRFDAPEPVLVYGVAERYFECVIDERPATMRCTIVTRFGELVSVDVERVGL